MQGYERSYSYEDYLVNYAKSAYKADTGKKLKLKNKLRYISSILNAIYRVDLRDKTKEYDAHLKNLAIENFWKRDGSKTLFIETPQLVHDIFNSKFNVEHLNSIDFGVHTKMIIPPKNVVLGGIPLKPFIYHSKTLFECFSEVTRICKLINIPVLYSEITKEVIAAQGMEVDENFCAISVQYDEDNVYTFTVTPETLVESLRCDNYNDFCKEVTKGKESKTNDFGRQLIYEYTRFLAGLIIYSSVFVKAIRPGMPEGILKEFKDSLKKDSTETLKDPNTKGEKRTVRWHFRNLRNERYYRNEFANMKPGTRWIVVNAEIDPYTAIELFKVA